MIDAAFLVCFFALEEVFFAVFFGVAVLLVVDFAAVVFFFVEAVAAEVFFAAFLEAFSFSVRFTGIIIATSLR